MRHAMLAVVLICMLAVAACSRDASQSPASPQLSENPGVTAWADMPREGHALWGFYRVTIDPDSCEAAAVPLRSAAWHLNALKFVEPPEDGSFLSFSNVKVVGRQVGVDVKIKHPFIGMPHYCGFDVKGIVMGPADMIDVTDPTRTWAGGPNGLRVMNADGWTRWWNPTEFPDNGTIFSFHSGLCGTSDSPADLDATLCGYKVFAASLEPNDSLSHVLAFPLTHPNGRAVFTSSGIETRRYELVFPGDGSGGPDMIFNYAIDASHGFPPDYTPGGYIEVPGGFPPEANQLEPFVIDVNLPLNSVYLSPEGCVGGALQLLIRVSDWQALLADTLIGEQIQSIELTSPTLFTGKRIPELIGEWTSSTPWATYRITLEGLTPDSILDQQVLVTIISSQGDYQKDVSSFTGASPLSAYYVVRVPVSQSTPIGGSGFALNPLSPWPKPGGTNHNSNQINTLGPVNPEIAWEVPGLTSDTMPVVDPEGRVFASRRLESGGASLVVCDPQGFEVACLDFPEFDAAGDPMMVGCSLLWNDLEGNVIRLFQDGGSELAFVPIPGPGPYSYGMLNIDDDGHAFVYGPSSIQAFDQYGGLLWARYGIDGAPSMFIGPPTVTAGGQVVVGKLDLDGGPPGEFVFWGLSPEDGEVMWTHKPAYDDAIPYGSAADPLTGQIYYAITNHIVALSGNGEQRWVFDDDDYFLPDIAIAPDGTIYAAESVLGQTGGSSKLVALSSPGGQLEWDFDCEGGISAGPITDATGTVYFATDDGSVRCLGPDGSERWLVDLDGRPSYLTFGPQHGILAGVRQTLFHTKLVCLQDE